MNITETLFTCTRDNLTIRGMQCFPVDFKENKKYPAIIFSHGFTANYLSMAQFCRDFTEIGYVTFCFNFCGGGKLQDDDSLKSDGKTTDMSVFSEVEDLSAVIEYAKNLSFIDKDNMILAGVSQGGFVSGLTAAKHKDEISRLVMIFPALCIPDHARRGCLGGASYDPLNVPDTIECSNTVLGKKFHDEVVDFDPFLALSVYEKPVLIIHGLDDKIVNYSYSIRAKESYRDNQCHLELVRNMGHSTDGRYYQGTVDSIRQFLNNREEILTIRIILTRTESKMEGEIKKSNLFFNGYCETKYFQGTVLPGGCDAQEHCGNELTKMRAEYTLEGLDIDGKLCTIDIVNQRGKTDWEPVIKTDSKALDWLNNARLTAVLESGEGGPTIRIYADKADIPG